MNHSKKKIIIIGAGAAGLMAAAELERYGCKNFLILEAGLAVTRRKCVNLGHCRQCDSCQILFGVGGAGLFSDGKMNFSDQIGGAILNILSKKKYEQFVSHLIGTYQLTVEYPDKIVKKPIVDALKAVHAIFLKVPQAHLGSENLPQFIESRFKAILNRVVESCMVESIEIENGQFRVLTDKGHYCCRHLIVATGQAGAGFAMSVARRFGLKILPAPADIGVRVEAHSDVLNAMTEIQWDPKIYFHTEYGNVRTFCTNPRGFVITEAKNGAVTCNGYAMKNKKSNNTNFALMTKIMVENPRAYLINIARTITEMTNNKLMLQKAEDFVNLVKTEKLAKIKPTTSCYSTGNLSYYLPYLPYQAIRETLKKINTVIPQFFEKESIVYAPEIKLYTNTIEIINEGFESALNRLYFLGDCCGHIHGLTNAMISAIACASHIHNSI